MKHRRASAEDDTEGQSSRKPTLAEDDTEGQKFRKPRLAEDDTEGQKFRSPVGRGRGTVEEEVTLAATERPPPGGLSFA